MTDLCVNQEETGTSPFSQAFCFSLLVARKVPCDVAYLIYIPFPSPTPFSSSFIRSYFLSSTCPFFPLSSAKRVYEKHRRYRRHLLPSQSLSSLSLSLSLPSSPLADARTHARLAVARPAAREPIHSHSLAAAVPLPSLPPPSQLETHLPTLSSPSRCAAASPPFVRPLSAVESQIVASSLRSAPLRQR